MLRQGLYIAENDESIWNAYSIEMRVKETEKSYIFELVKLESRYAASHIETFFSKDKRVVLRKNKGGHAMRVWGEDSFTFYPYQAGIPYYFKLAKEKAHMEMRIHKDEFNAVNAVAEKHKGLSLSREKYLIRPFKDWYDFLKEGSELHHAVHYYAINQYRKGLDYLLSKEELKKLMPEMCTTNWLLETMFALFCGLRKGEILGLKFSDIDLDERTVSIQRQVTMEYSFDADGKRVGQRPTEKEPKTENAYRTLRFPQIMVPEIRKRKMQIEKNKNALGDDYFDNDYISCQKNGLSSSLSAFNLALERACKRSGVRKATVHSLRHVFATVLMEKGVPLVKISAVLGHSSIHTTFEFYCDVIDEKERIKDYINDTFSVDEMEEEDGT